MLLTPSPNQSMLSVFHLFARAGSVIRYAGSISRSDSVPCSGIEPWTPALGAWSLSHWTTREVPHIFFLKLIIHRVYRNLCQKL